MFESVALLDFCDGEQPRPCQVLDISNGGARLIVFADTSAIPDTFTLLLSPSAKVRRVCHVAWRTERELGVKFQPLPKQAPVEPGGEFRPDVVKLDT